VSDILRDAAALPPLDLTPVTNDELREIAVGLIDCFTEARTRGTPGRRLIVVDNGRQWAAGFWTHALHHAETLYDALRQAIEHDLP